MKCRDWDRNTGQGIRIVVIDSGVNSLHPLMRDHHFTGISIQERNHESVISKDFSDSIGHGTGVSYIIKSHAENSGVFMIRIYDDDLTTTETLLLEALNYVETHLDCDIINVSCGLHRCSNIGLLKKTCERLTEKGIVIVAAYDNYGRMSYPAAFPNVLGVDSTMSCYRKDEYQYVESNIVNIRGSIYESRLPGLGDSFFVDGGSSFVAPYISAMVAKIMQAGIRAFDQIREEIRRGANHIYTANRHLGAFSGFPIKKAALFPFNKEMHALFRFSDQLPFQIESVYDIKHSLNVKKDVGQIIGTEEAMIVKNINDFPWLSTDIDTMIIGNLTKTNEALKYDIKLEVLEGCLKNGINVYSFDMHGISEAIQTEFQASGLQLFCPRVTNLNVPKNRFGKLFENAKPVLAILGTGPKQGKYTVQLQLRKLLLNNGYRVGQLGTEPSALLFGMDEIYNMGFNSAVEIVGSQSVTYVNELMHKIELKDPDIILVGSQSQTLPRGSGNLGYYPINQFEFLLGIQADAFVLCVTVGEEPTFIMRNIAFIEAINEAKPIAIAVFPYQYTNVFGNLVGKSEMVDEVIVDQYRVALMEKLGISAFVISREDDMQALYEECIVFFAENE